MLESGVLDLSKVSEAAIRELLEIYDEYGYSDYEQRIRSLESGLVAASRIIPIVRSLEGVGHVFRNVSFV